MSDFGKFEKELIEQFDQHQIEKDYDNLWNKLEPTLPKKKRRYFFVWFFGLALILFGAVVFIDFNKSSNIGNEPNLPTESTEYAGNEIEYQVKESSKTTSLPTSEVENLATAGLNTEPLNADKKVDHNAKAIIRNDGFKAQKITQNPIDFGNTFESVSESDNQKLLFNNVIDEVSNKALEMNALNTINEETPSKSVELVWLETLALLDSRLYYEPAFFSINLPLIDVEKPEQIISTSKFSFGIDVLGGSFMTKGRLPNDLMHLQGNIKPSGTYDLGIFQSYKFSPIISAELSTRYFNSIEKFDYQNETTSIENVINEQAYLVSNMYYLSANQEAEVNTSYDILNYNKLSGFAFQPAITIHPLKARKLGVSLSCSIVLTQSYNGLLLDEDFKLVDSGSLLRSRTTSILNPGLSISYQLNLFGSLDSRFLINYQFSQIASSEQRHYYRVGVRVGI